MPSKTTDTFLELACAWAFDNGRLLVDDGDFLRQLRARGISDAAIPRIKQELERRGAITNHYVIGGMRDFSVNRSAFHEYVRQAIPRDTLHRA